MNPFVIQVILYAIKIGIVFGGILAVVPFIVLLERKLVARIQQRLGPNRVGPWGLLQGIVDGIKLFLKEDIRPASVDVVLHSLAPLITVVPAIMILAIIPFGPAIFLEVPDAGFAEAVPLGITDLPIGILFYLAVTSIAVYGIVLAGYSSNSKYSLLGGIRSSAQMLSYELALGLSLVGVLLIAGTFDLRPLLGMQEGGIWHWNFVRQPVGALLFLVAGFAETNRLPFDLAEGESELGGGFHTEYSSMKFALFFLAEYMNMFTFSAILATLFFGGYYGPFPILPASLLEIINQPVSLFGLVTISGIGSALIGAFWICFKIFLMLCFFIFIRGTLPRFRYDQLMDLGWKVMFPVALVNMIVTAAIIAFFGGEREAIGTPTHLGLTALLFLGGVAILIFVDMILSARKKRMLGHAH